MENKNITGIILAIGIILVSLFIVYQTKDVSGNVLTVNGEYKTQTTPDKADITFSMLTTAPTASDAASQNANTLAAVLIKLKEAGLTDKDIQTVNYYVNEKKVWVNNAYVSEGYQAVNTVKITITDITKSGIYLDLLTKNGINNVNNIEFGLTDTARNKIYTTALAKAGEDARTKADEIAKGLGVKVKGIKTISVSQPSYPIMYSMYKSELASASASTTPIEPRTIDIDVTVVVGFKI